MPTFSIIVPAYNAEKTLHTCLESLLAQTYGDFEVHMVENGSEDATRSICRAYAEKDPRFLLHAIDQNRGPSGARNVGLDLAQGTYVTFLDSDDSVVPEYLEVLRSAFSRADVVFFGYHPVLADGTSLEDRIPALPDGPDYYETLLQLSRQDLFGYTWIKAFRRTLIGNHRFSPELNLMEDEVFACEVLAEPCRVAVVPKAIVNYLTANPGSLMGRTHPDYCRKVDAVYLAWKQLLQSYEKRDEVLPPMADSYVSRCMYYGFERDVDTRAFFRDLADSIFFADTTQESMFVHAVRSHHYEKISRMRASYRMKNILFTLLKR